MVSFNYGLLIKDNDRLIKQIEEFVSDSRFINNDTSDDTENEFGLCNGFVSHGLISMPVLCVELIHKNLIVIETKRLTSWEKEKIIGQTKLLIELYFEKLCKNEPEYGAFTAKQFVDRLSERYPNEYVNTYIESTSFTKEFLLSILGEHSDSNKLPVTILSNKSKKDQMPFIIGLEFAKGKPQELYKLYNEEKLTFEEITLRLGFAKVNRTYISTTLNDNEGSKNIYNNKRVMSLIEEHCIENNIEMCPDFIEKLKSIKFR